MAFAFNYWWLDTDNLYITVSFRQSVRNSVNFCRSSEHIQRSRVYFRKSFQNFKKNYSWEMYIQGGFKNMFLPHNLLHSHQRGLQIISKKNPMTERRSSSRRKATLLLIGFFLFITLQQKFLSSDDFLDKRNAFLKQKYKIVIVVLC